MYAEIRVRKLIPVLGSQPAGDVNHKPGGRLPLLSVRPAVTLVILKRTAIQFRCLVNRGNPSAIRGVNSLPKTVTRQRRGCDLNPRDCNSMYFNGSVQTLYAALRGAVFLVFFHWPVSYVYVLSGSR